MSDRERLADEIENSRYIMSNGFLISSEQRAMIAAALRAGPAQSPAPEPVAPESGWLKPALDTASDRVADMPSWMTRNAAPQPQPPARSDVQEMVATLRNPGPRLYHVGEYLNRVANLIEQLDTARNPLALTAPQPQHGGMREEVMRALKPFAKAAELAENDEPNKTTLFSSSSRHAITLGDLKRAAKVFAALTSSDHREGGS